MPPRRSYSDNTSSDGAYQLGSAFGDLIFGSDRLEKREDAAAQKELDRKLAYEKALLDLQDKSALSKIVYAATMSDVAAAQARQRMAYDIAASKQASNEPLTDASGNPLPITDPSVVGWARNQVTNLGEANINRGLSYALAAGAGADVSRRESDLTSALLQSPEGINSFNQGKSALYRQPYTAERGINSQIADREQQQIFEAARIKFAKEQADRAEAQRQFDNANRVFQQNRDFSLNQRVFRPTYDPQSGESYLPPMAEAFESFTPMGQKQIEFKTSPGGTLNTMGRRVAASKVFNPAELSSSAPVITPEPFAGGVSVADMASALVPRKEFSFEGFQPYGRVKFSPLGQTQPIAKAAPPAPRAATLPPELEELKNFPNNRAVKSALGAAIARNTGLTNRFDPRLQLGSSAFYQTPQAYVRDNFESDQPMQDAWNRLPDEAKARIYKSALVGAKSGIFDSPNYWNTLR